MDDYNWVMITKSLCSMPERLIQQFYGPYWVWVWLKYYWIMSGKIVTMSGKCQGISTGVVRGNPEWGSTWARLCRIQISETAGWMLISIFEMPHRKSQYSQGIGHTVDMCDREHCDNKTLQIGPNHDHNMTFLIWPDRCLYSALNRYTGSLKTSYQICKIVDCICTWNAGNVFPVTVG